MRDEFGRVAMRLRPPGSKPRPVHQWAGKGEDRYVYLSGDRYVVVYWIPWKGLLPGECGSLSGRSPVRVWDSGRMIEMALKRRDVTTPTSRPALPAESAALKRFPTLCEWLTATTYDDGSVRVPGYLWFSNRGIAFEVTLFDPDACVKMPCLGRTIDEALACAETHLRAEDAPWQPDPYLADRKASQGRGKKK